MDIFQPSKVGVYNYYYIVRRLLNLEVVRLMIITRWVCENEAKYVHYFDTVRINWFMIETLFWKLLFSLKPFVCDEWQNMRWVSIPWTSQIGQNPFWQTHCTMPFKASLILAKTGQNRQNFAFSILKSILVWGKKHNHRWWRWWLISAMAVRAYAHWEMWN